MAVSVRVLLRSTIWTVGGFGIGQALRLVTNIVLARLLAPELFGTMLIINTIVIGITLISDIGLNQSLIYHKNANDPDYYNTAWTIQAIRSVGLWLIAVILAVPLANFYQSPNLLYLIPITALGIVISGFSSISRTLLQKGMRAATLNTYEITLSFISSAAYILIAYFSPTIWALVSGLLFGNVVTTIASYFLIPGLKQKFHLSKPIALEMLHYGKWITVSSVLYFMSTNFDRLYLAAVVPLNLLGVYGIARSIADMVGLVVLRFGSYVLFPFIASHSQVPRADLHAQLAPIRIKFLALTAIGFSLLVATADLPIRIFYDQRYQAAGWMLPVMIFGSWFTILANVNEAALLGIGRPSYSAISNLSKFAFLLIALPISIKAYGLLGGIVIIVLADLWRYIPILIGQRRERFSHGKQDLLATFSVLLLIGIWEWLRWKSGFGNSLESLPVHLWST